MKKLESIRAFVILTIVYVVFSGSSCFNTNDAERPCGDAAIWEHTFAVDSFYRTDVIGNLRSFTYEDVSTPIDICPLQHVQIDYSVWPQYVYRTKPDSVKVIGVAYWAFLYEHETVLDLSTQASDPKRYLGFEGNDQVGLKQAFGEKPAWIGLQIHVQFPTRGTVEEDLDYLDSLADHLYIRLDYAKAKSSK